MTGQPSPDALGPLLAKPPLDIQQISLCLDDILAEAVSAVNFDFSPTRLSKLPREVEPIPTDQRQLSSYRTRIGTMLEYALSTQLNRLLGRLTDNQYYLTFATSHEYPDFYLRSADLQPILRIEMKAVDAESDEQAARFSTPTVWINESTDLLMLVAWEWTAINSPARTSDGECPIIFASTIIPAADIARERDARLAITGGKIEGEQVLVPSTRDRGNFVLDPGNYGKFWRIVHRSRLRAADLSPSIHRFLEFLQKVDARSPRDRLSDLGEEPT